MNDTTVPENATTANTVADEQAVPAPSPRPGGALRALVIGLIVAVALGLTLLTWALSLMFMLGLFFFMLFGLLVGACMFRAGARSRPMPKSRVITVTAIVAAVGWATALGKECADFPDDFVETLMRKRASAGVRLYIPKDGYHQVEGEVRKFITGYLARDYPLGSWVAYLQHAATGSKIRLDLPSQVIDVPPRVSAWVWWTRVLLALPLFFLTTYSVTVGLSRLPDATEKRKHY